MHLRKNGNMYRIYSTVIGEYVKKPEKGSQKTKGGPHVIFIYLAWGGWQRIKILKSAPGQKDLGQPITFHVANTYVT